MMSRQYEGKLIDLGKIGYLDPEVTILTLEDTGEYIINNVYNWMKQNLGEQLMITANETSYSIEVIGETKSVKGDQNEY